MARMSRQELAELIESVEEGGGDASPLKALLAEVDSDMQKRGLDRRLRKTAPHRGLRSTGDEEMTTQERLEYKVGDLFPDGITDDVLETLYEMDRDHGLKELKRMCVKVGISPNGDKKTLAAKLLAYSNLNPGEKKEEAGNPSIIYGWLTPPLMEELKKMAEITEWPPPVEPSPTFSAVLQVCDYAFTLKVLKMKCDEMNISKSGHKKILIARLLNVEEEELTDIAQRTIAELEASGNEDEERTLEEVTDIARKVVGT
ncbi:hypothetical protein KKE60_06205 [Patescibacteria group bacterium]|nr:hypothetical protein [Patescibacteria group bacterium]